VAAPPGVQLYSPAEAVLDQPISSSPGRNGAGVERRSPAVGAQNQTAFWGAGGSGSSGSGKRARGGPQPNRRPLRPALPIRWEKTSGERGRLAPRGVGAIVRRTGCDDSWTDSIMGKRLWRRPSRSAATLHEKANNLAPHVRHAQGLHNDGPRSALPLSSDRRCSHRRGSGPCPRGSSKRSRSTGSTST
jgi:hypothetical protein